MKNSCLSLILIALLTAFAGCASYEPEPVTAGVYDSDWGVYDSAWYDDDFGDDWFYDSYAYDDIDWGYNWDSWGYDWGYDYAGIYDDEWGDDDWFYDGYELGYWEPWGDEGLV